MREVREIDPQASVNRRESLLGRAIHYIPLLVDIYERLSQLNHFFQLDSLIPKISL
jgi:hypothetical protein